MAATNDNETKPIEACPGSVIIPKVISPDDRVIDNYAMGWDNLVDEEIIFFHHRFNLEGDPSEFELEWTNDEEGPIILDRKQKIEFYKKQLLSYCTITLVSSGNASLGLPALGVKPKETKQPQLNDGVNTSMASSENNS